MSTVCLFIPEQLSRSGSNTQSTPPGVHGSHHGPTLTLRIKPFHRIEDRVSIMATCWNQQQKQAVTLSSPSLVITLASFPGLHAHTVPRFETKLLRDGCNTTVITWKCFMLFTPCSEPSLWKVQHLQLSTTSKV